jgi:hypothetical protein
MARSIRIAPRRRAPCRQEGAHRIVARALTPRRHACGLRYLRCGRGELFEVARVGGGQPILGIAGNNLKWDTVSAA